MRFHQRILRHIRLTAQTYLNRRTPPFLILFINSICNQKCEHCFYWKNLNRRDDLTRDELFTLSRSLGRVETLNLSGGEPFIREDFAEITRQFIQNNKVRQIYVPTNGTMTDRTVAAVTETLKEKTLDLFVVEFSLDGMPAFHDKFRGMANGFERSMETYEALTKLQEEDSRLKLHANSVATDVNMDEIRQLTTYLFERCPKIEHHNLAMIRGDRKNPALSAPQLGEYDSLYDYIRRLWESRESGRYGSIVEPMLQSAKLKTAKQTTQVVPCRAGALTTVVYSNGDVSVCESHEPLGNLREQSFGDIWWSEKARLLRKSISRRECWCTNEVFLWPSIVYQPFQLIKSLLSSKAMRRLQPLPDGERVFVSLDLPRNGAETGEQELLPVVQPTEEPS